MKVGGRDFDLTKQQVEVRMEGAEPESIQKHAVEIDGQLFPPKQVLSQVTGWERTSFTTMEAQRVLTRLGFVCTEVRGGLMRQAGEFVKEAVRDSARQAMSEHDFKFQRGFTSAAGISLRRIQSKLECSRMCRHAASLISTSRKAAIRRISPGMSAFRVLKWTSSTLGCRRACHQDSRCDQIDQKG